MKRCLNGFATIAISLVLLLGVSIIVLFSTKSAVSEQKVTSNDIRMKEAFEAASSGLNKGVMYLASNRADIIVDVSPADGYIDALPIADAAGGTLPNNATYSVTMTNPVAADMSIVTISSTGTSTDGTVTRTITQSYSSKGALNGMPPTPFTARGAVNISGNLNIENMHTPTSIWSGGTVTYGGSAKSCNSTVCSNKSGKSGDAKESDPVLSGMSNDEFFQNFFKTNIDSLKQGSQVKFTSTANNNYSAKLDGLENKLIWIDQSGGGEVQINSNTVIGSPDKPVVLIMQGDVRLNGKLTVYGVVYIDNDWHNSGGGTLTVQGSTIINGDYSGVGTPDINYDPTILGKLESDIGYYTSIAGSWRDF